MNGSGQNLANALEYSLACLFFKTYLYDFGIDGGTTSYLVHMCFQVMTINYITCCCGNVVTMETEAYILNFAV